MTEGSISDVMQAHAQNAVNCARDNFQINLDYSEESIKQVEYILAKIHDGLPKGPITRIIRKCPSKGDINQMSIIWGAYVGEVMLRRWNGNWKTNTNSQSETVITLQIFDCNIYPPAKVFNRITNGDEDNIWIYYQVLKQGFDTYQTQRK